MNSMSALILGVALGSLIVLLGQTILIFLGSTLLDRTVAQLDEMLGLRERAHVPVDDVAPADTIDAEVVGERGAVRLPLDPDNPPTWRVARVDRDDVPCNCHGRPVRAGERLLFWPMGDGVMRVYHEDATEAEGL